MKFQHSTRTFLFSTSFCFLRSACSTNGQDALPRQPGDVEMVENECDEGDDSQLAASLQALAADSPAVKVGGSTVKGQV